MPGRKFSAGSAYRYGFNGQEKSDDITAGNYTSEYWEYDSKVGRRWNRDKEYKHSPYEVFGSNPIWNIDPSGADTIRFTIRNTIYASKAGPSDMRFGGGGISSSSITILQAPGKDVFFFEVYNEHADANGNMVSGKPRITQFYPNDYSSATGITRSENDVLPGTHKDYDFITLAKFINASPKLGVYLVNHNANYKFIQDYANEVKRDEIARKFAAPIADLIFLAVGIGEARIAARTANEGLKFSLNESNSFYGAKSSEVKAFLESNGWQGIKTNPRKVYNDGIRYTNGVKGEQIRIMPGGANRSIPEKRGPYMEISKYSKKTVVPLAGNPTIK